MKVSYKGIKDDLPAKLQQKLDAKFAKLSKLVDGRGEKQAHVVVTSERHLHKAEITLHVHNHQLVGIGSDSDVFSAMSAALDRIEKQATKQGARWRDTTRRSEPMKTATARAEAPVAPTKKSSRKLQQPVPTSACSAPIITSAASPSRSRRRCSRWKTAAIMWLTVTRINRCSRS